MARIQMRQVEAFRAVMLTGGMTQAAEMMGVTQPAVSRLVQAFEEALGLVLFERRGNQVVPTADAAALLAEVERSFVGLDRIQDLAKGIRSHAAGSLRIVALPALATSALPRYLGAFLRKRPDVRAYLHGMPSHLVAEAVASGQADFAYAAGPLERPGFIVEPLPGPAVVVVRPDHPLARKTVIEAADLEGERQVAVGTGTLFRARVDAALAGISRITVVETPLTEIACVLASEGVGFGIVDPFAAGAQVGPRLVARPFRPAIDPGNVMVRLPNRPLTSLARSFIAGFKEDLARRAAGDLHAEPHP